MVSRFVAEACHSVTGIVLISHIVMLWESFNRKVIRNGDNLLKHEVIPMLFLSEETKHECQSAVSFVYCNLYGYISTVLPSGTRKKPAFTHHAN